ncbi:multiple antibiotic resistance regulatory protein MarB [Shimwellia blattae]|nr:multiple antibiotic resistance regulatory protein MarB [Shimwellia blattae]GAB82094.1 multiple antibiotic resistance protein MarB [Shimwellia blattae DSM 4481 = NBRC 105725]VDY64264.1 Uncharacterised protein [Shimwellia blattae]VEC22389.1 Uncharacterised protein [Shimwellia blattae]
MRHLLCVVATAAVLVSGQVCADQPEDLTWQPPVRGGMLLPSVDSWRAVDLNATENRADKSDALGVPYYHQGTTR